MGGLECCAHHLIAMLRTNEVQLSRRDGGRNTLLSYRYSQRFLTPTSHNHYYEHNQGHNGLLLVPAASILGEQTWCLWGQSHFLPGATKVHPPRRGHHDVIEMNLFEMMEVITTTKDNPSFPPRASQLGVRGVLP